MTDEELDKCMQETAELEKQYKKLFPDDSWDIGGFLIAFGSEGTLEYLRKAVKENKRIDIKYNDDELDGGEIIFID